MAHAVQENKKNIFMFKYSGHVFDEYVITLLDIKHMEGFVDASDSYVNVLIYTFDRHRPSELKNKIDSHNKELSHEPRKQIHIRQQSQFDDEIMTLSGCRTPKNHAFYLRILSAKEKKDPTYFIWPISQSQVRERNLKNELHIDMLGSAIEPDIGKRRVLRRDNDEARKSKKTAIDHCTEDGTGEAEESNDIPTTDGGVLQLQNISPSTQGATLVEIVPHALSDIAENYVSDDEAILDNAAESPEIINDDSSRDSDLLGQLSPNSRSLGHVISKVLNRSLRGIRDSNTRVETSIAEIKRNTELRMHNDEENSFLLNKVKEQEIEIEEHKHKRKVQEGRTSHQTRLANIAMQAEKQAKEDLSKARQNETYERNLRERIEVSNGALLISNVNMSNSIRNLAVGNQVSDWECKNGYSYLPRFVDFLTLDHLCGEPTRRSLKGVAPALPFSDIAFRRYFDHALAYVDFKEASKSEDKHRLYLGFLNGPLYPEAVLYAFRERLLDQAKQLCECLGRECPPVEALPPPIDGDPFEIEEMQPWKFCEETMHDVNKEKMKNMRRYFPGPEPKIHWYYLVFVHRCNFKGRLEREDTETILEMLQGPMYDEKGFEAMEQPLLEVLISLRSELKSRNLKLYRQLETKWQQITDQMERPRDSSHRVLSDADGRANEYIAFVKDQRRRSEAQEPVQAQ